MIKSDDIRDWYAGSEVKDLTELEGGANLRLRFASFLGRHHPDILQAYLESGASEGPYAVERLLSEALTEVTRSALKGTLSGEAPWELLAEWIRQDEDAYELINQLRP